MGRALIRPPARARVAAAAGSGACKTTRGSEEIGKARAEDAAASAAVCGQRCRGACYVAAATVASRQSEARPGQRKQLQRGLPPERLVSAAFFLRHLPTLADRRPVTRSQASRTASLMSSQVENPLELSSPGGGVDRGPLDRSKVPAAVNGFEPGCKRG